MGLIYLDACALIDAREKSTPESQALVNLIVEGRRFKCVQLTVAAVNSLRTELIS